MIPYDPSRNTRSTEEDRGALGTKVSEILNSIREGYDKRVRPNYGGSHHISPDFRHESNDDDDECNGD